MSNNHNNIANSFSRRVNYLNYLKISSRITIPRDMFDVCLTFNNQNTFTSHPCVFWIAYNNQNNIAFPLGASFVCLLVYKHENSARIIMACVFLDTRNISLPMLFGDIS